MQHEAVFEGVVSFSLAYRESNSYGRLRVTPDIAYHNGRAMAFLRKKLEHPQTCADDAAIMTTMLLCDGAVWLDPIALIIRELIGRFRQSTVPKWN